VRRCALAFCGGQAQGSKGNEDRPDPLIARNEGLVGPAADPENPPPLPGDHGQAWSAPDVPAVPNPALLGKKRRRRLGPARSMACRKAGEGDG
jgi:hypothetical protein